MAIFGASFSARAPSVDAADGATLFAATRASSARASFALGDEFGDDAARELARILALLADAGFAKASASAYSVFDRILGGVCWLLQHIVPREDAARGRVAWELLFQPHDKLKPRLGLAQDVIARVAALPLACPHAVQAHQLLLQDFGDIGAVRRLVAWLAELAADAPHLERIASTRAYLAVVDPSPIDQETAAQRPIKREVAYLQSVYAPRRRWQYTTNDADEAEDAAVQRCLLEYGERVAVATVTLPPEANNDGVATDAAAVDGGVDPRRSLMAQLAAASAASVSRRGDLTAATQEKSGSTTRPATTTASRAKSEDAREFEAQYERVMQQAMAEQAALLERQRAREAELLRHVVSVPPEAAGASDADERDGSGGDATETAIQIQKEQAALRDHQVRLATLEEEQRLIYVQREQLEAQRLVLDGATQELLTESLQLDAEEQANVDAEPFVATLRELVAENETLKKRKSEFKAQCKTEMEALQVRVTQLRAQAEQEAAQQDEETLRLNEIEQMHAQMATKHAELRCALARQTREFHINMKRIDDVPTRIELVQYEKRFLELYDEVALTLDETRKYYCVYNTLKTTHEFLEKEISLINSMHDNFDVAMGSRPATQAFFSQLDAIVQNVESSVRKQQTLRGDHHERVETLDCKYQLLLEKERMYVNAIREFQKECERNEKLSTKMAHLQQRRRVPEEKEEEEGEAPPAVAAAAAVSPNDAVI